jgi:hypothetical protein
MSWRTSISRGLSASTSGWADKAGSLWDVPSLPCSLASSATSNFLMYSDFRPGVTAADTRRHWTTFINKGPDEAARLGQRQRIMKHVHSFVLIALCLERERLEH